MNEALVVYYISLTASYEDALDLLTPYILVKEHNIFTGEDDFRHYPMSSLEKLKEEGIVEEPNIPDVPTMSCMVAHKVERE